MHFGGGSIKPSRPGSPRNPNLIVGHVTNAPRVLGYLGHKCVAKFLARVGRERMKEEGGREKEG